MQTSVCCKQVAEDDIMEKGHRSGIPVFKRFTPKLNTNGTLAGNGPQGSNPSLPCEPDSPPALREPPPPSPPIDIPRRSSSYQSDDEQVS
ncbi:hypothetical protein ACF0H5_001999 [Mactra antiquata]